MPSTMCPIVAFRIMDGCISEAGKDAPDADAFDAAIRTCETEIDEVCALSGVSADDLWEIGFNFYYEV